jgi:hypothetical protein
MGVLEDQMQQARANINADQVEADRRLHPERYASPAAPVQLPASALGVERAAREIVQAQEKLATLRAKYPTLNLEKLPTAMTDAEFSAYVKATQAIQLQQQREAAAAPPLPAGQKHPRDMTDAEYAAYRRAWEQNARAKHGG